MGETQIFKGNFDFREVLIQMNDLSPSIPMDVAVGDSNNMESGATGGSNGWTGLTIREILEKVDLFNITTVDEEDMKNEKTGSPIANYSKNKEGKTVISANNPESAFLGPKLWDKPIALPPLDDTEFSVMNIDEFLNENNINLDAELGKQQQQPRERLDSDSIPLGWSATSPELFAQEVMSPESTASSSVTDPNGGRNQLPKGGDNSFLYAESKRARLEREKAERKRKLELQVDFAPEDLALATIPGADFDPRTRRFTTDELRPQPIIRKRKKQYVMTESKDQRYWEKRIKNNIAARRSREARRLKENQIALRAAFLEKENNALKAQVDDVMEENAKLKKEKEILMQKLSRFEM